MFDAIVKLDRRIGPRLVRPFWIAGSALAVVLFGFGLITGLATMQISVLIGLFLIALGALLGVTVLLGVRLTVEAVSLIFAQAGVAAPRPPGSGFSTTA